MRILGVLQKNLVAKCDLSVLVDPGDMGMAQTLGLLVCDKGGPRLGLG